MQQQPKVCACPGGSSFCGSCGTNHAAAVCRHVSDGDENGALFHLATHTLAGAKMICGWIQQSEDLQSWLLLRSATARWIQSSPEPSATAFTPGTTETVGLPSSFCGTGYDRRRTRSGMGMDCPRSVCVCQDGYATGGCKGG